MTFLLGHVAKVQVADESDPMRDKEANCELQEQHYCSILLRDVSFVERQGLEAKNTIPSSPHSLVASTEGFELSFGHHRTVQGSL